MVEKDVPVRNPIVRRSIANVFSVVSPVESYANVLDVRILNLR